MVLVNRFILLLLLILPLFACASDEPLTRVAFGSCNRQDKPQTIWPIVSRNQPQLWIWTGDIIYGDTEDMDVLRQKYDLLKHNPAYTAFRQDTSVIGVWDDHDYGLNDGGKEFGPREQSQQVLLDFLDEPKDSPRRKRAGVHAAYTYGKPGKQVKVILLDGRYHRDHPDEEDADILGEGQWAWLEQELSQSQAQIHLIACGIQIVASDHPFEKWANFPNSQKRLYDLIGKLKVPGVIFISGDRHLSEISRNSSTPVGYPLYDITSSGMTHSYSTFNGEPNRLRVGKVWPNKHFGMIEIDWDASPVQIELRIHDLKNKPRIKETLSLDELQPR